MAKKTRANKSRQEVLATMKNNADFQRRLTFIKDKFWPALVIAGDSIEETQSFLGGFNTMLMQEFLGFMSKTKFADLNLGEKISDEARKYEDILALFADMSVYDAKDIIEGMRNEIELFKRDEDRNRPLSSLTPKWIDQL